MLTEARHVVLPDGIVSSGFPAVRETCQRIGITFDPWQEEMNRCILAKDAAGLYAADTVAISICRQAGKTFDVGGLVFADCIITPGSTTVWTAHRFKVARETFAALKVLATSRAMGPHVDPDQIYSGAGNESITFRNGSRVVFAARERGAVRGFAKVRRLILDEAQILTESVMADFAPTMNQAENPQMILMGTPPKPTDPGEIFTGLRDDALAGTSEELLYVEFSADDDADLDDREQWAKANPSYPKRTPTRAIKRLRKLLTNDDDFAREALGIWGGIASQQVIKPDVWARQADESSRPVSGFTLGIAVAQDRSASSVALAGLRADGDWHVELDERSGDDVSWVAPWVADRIKKNAGSKSRIRAVVADSSSPAATVVADLARLRIKTTTTSARQVAEAFGAFYDGVHDGTVWHTNQHQVNEALRNARKRDLVGGSAWARKDARSDSTPIEAETFALWGAQALRVKRPGGGRDGSGGRTGTMLG